MLSTQYQPSSFRQKPEFIEDPEKAVCLKGIPKNEPRETIYEFAKQLGWVKRLDLPPSRDGITMNKGFCFVHFKEKEAASRLLDRGVTPYKNTRRMLQVEPYKARVEKDRRSNPVSGYSTLAVSKDHSTEISRSQSPLVNSNRPAPLDLSNVNNDTPRNQPPTPHEINESVQRIYRELPQIRQETYPIQPQVTDLQQAKMIMDNVMKSEMEKAGITSISDDLMAQYYSLLGMQA